MVFLLFLFVVLRVVFAYNSSQTKRWNKGIASVASNYGLRVDRSGSRHSASGQTEAGLLTVGLTKKKDELFTEITCYVSGLPHSLELNAEGLGAAFKKLVRGKDLQVGDPDFDRKVVVRGGLPVVLPLLDAGTRATLSELLAGGAVHVSKGAVEFKRSGAMSNSKRLVALVAVVSEVAVALAQHSGEPVAARLLAMVETDPSPGVRKTAAMTLWQSCPNSDEARQAAELGLKTRDPELRMMAGNRLLTVEARHTLIGVALDGRAPATVQAAAIHGLAARADAAEAAPEILRAVPRMSGSRLVAALSFLAHTDHLPSLSLLKNRYNNVGIEARLAVIAIAQRHGSDAVPVLLEMVDGFAESTGVAAVQALGKLAALPTVMPLLEVQGGKYPRAVRSAARNAIGQIQSRVATGPSGGLAVSDAAGEEGALAVDKELGIGAVSVHE